MKLRRAVTHLAVASLTFVILVITVDRPALAQFGDLLDKAKQAAESARKAGETVREALGSGTGAPVSPAKGGDAPATPPAGESGGNSDSTCLRETGMVRWHYQNNCGVDLTVLFASKDRPSCTGHWLYAGQSTTIAPTAAACRGRAERGLCACPAGSGMETPSGRPGEFGASIRAPVGVVGGMSREATVAPTRAEPVPAPEAKRESVRVRNASFEGAPACFRHVSNESRGKLYLNECATDVTLLLHRQDGECIPFVAGQKRHEYVSAPMTVCTGRVDTPSRDCRCS